MTRYEIYKVTGAKSIWMRFKAVSLSCWKLVSVYSCIKQGVSWRAAICFLRYRESVCSWLSAARDGVDEWIRGGIISCYRPLFTLTLSELQDYPSRLCDGLHYSTDWCCRTLSKFSKGPISFRTPLCNTIEGMVRSIAVLWEIRKLDLPAMAIEELKRMLVCPPCCK